MTTIFPTLLFARHGRTAWNLAGRYQGRSDPPISPEGETDAQAIAESLSGERLTAIVASPSQRAMMTAQIIGERLGVSRMQVDGRLLELAYGDWEGLTQAEVKARWPEQLRLWKRTPEAMRFPGGETLAEARARLLAFVRGSAVLGGTAGSVLAVGHGGMIRLAILEATGAPLAGFRGVDMDHGSIQSFRLRRDGAAGFLSLSEVDSHTCELR